jgi:hypothetical protein
VADDVESLPAIGANRRHGRRPSRRAAATDATPISGPPAHGRAFAALPAGCGLIADLLGIPEPENWPPFSFGYLAFRAVHQPHQAPAEFTARYISTYQAGWSAISLFRYQRQVELGLMPAG